MSTEVVVAIRKLYPRKYNIIPERNADEIHELGLKLIDKCIKYIFSNPEAAPVFILDNIKEIKESSSIYRLIYRQECEKLQDIIERPINDMRRLTEAGETKPKKRNLTGSEIRTIDGLEDFLNSWSLVINYIDDIQEGLKDLMRKYYPELVKKKRRSIGLEQYLKDQDLIRFLKSQFPPMQPGERRTKDFVQLLFALHRLGLTDENLLQFKPKTVHELLQGTFLNIGSREAVSGNIHRINGNYDYLRLKGKLYDNKMEEQVSMIEDKIRSYLSTR